MRRTSGLRVGTIATLAVLLVALSVGAGVFALHPSGSVRTALGSHSDSFRSVAAPHVAAVAKAPSKLVAPHSHGAAIRPGAGANLTSVSLAPGTSTVAPGASEVLTATALCTGNVSCPGTVTYAWSSSSAFAGSLNASTGSTAMFTAGPSIANTMVSVAATYNNTTVNAAPATVNVFASGAPAITVTYTIPWKVYEIVPFTVTFNISVTNGTVGPSTTWVKLDVRDLTGGCGSQYSFLGQPPCPDVINETLAVASGQTSYSLQLNYSTLNQNHYADATHGVFPADIFQFIAWVTDNNGVANQTVGLEQNSYMVFQVPAGTFDSPVPGASLSTGNVTFVVTYGGDFIQAAQLVVENATHQVVFIQAVFAVGQGNRTVAAPTPWLAATPGTYTAVVNITTPYGSYTITQAYTVIPAGQTIYVNQTSYHNVSLLGGLSPGIAGMLLLLIGLIIGLVVALVLGRMMWGTPSQPASPQPWSPSSSSTTTTQTTTTGGSDMTSEGGGSSPKP